MAAAEDIQSGKVSNRRIAVGLMAGMWFRIMEDPAWGIYYFLGNISVPVVLLYLLFQMRVLGAGDIKLFSMIGSFLTMKELFTCMAYSFFSAGIWAVFLLAFDKKRRRRLAYAARYLAEIFLTGKILPYIPLYEAEGNTFAFSVPILFGTAAAIISFTVK